MRTCTGNSPVFAAHSASALTCPETKPRTARPGAAARRAAWSRRVGRNNPPKRGQASPDFKITLKMLAASQRRRLEMRCGRSSCTSASSIGAVGTLPASRLVRTNSCLLWRGRGVGAEACVSAPRGSSDICGLRGAGPRCTARARNELDPGFSFPAARSTLVAQANGQRGRAHALGWRLGRLASSAFRRSKGLSCAARSCSHPPLRSAEKHPEVRACVCEVALAAPAVTRRSPCRLQTHMQVKLGKTSCGANTVV